MKLLILHLCDLHCKEEVDIDQDKINSLLSVVGYAQRACDIILVIVSGDISFSGKKREYEIASSVFQKLIKVLTDSNKKYSIIVVPGNHDNDYSKNGRLRSLAIEDVNNTQDVNEELLAILSSVQSNYYEFVTAYHTDVIINNFQKQEHVVEYNGFTIAVNALNSALLCDLDTNPGRIIINPGMLEFSASDADVYILVMHHPLSWLNENIEKAVREKACLKYHILFTGHKHIESGYDTVFNDQPIKHFEGMEFSPITNNDSSGFSLVVYDTTEDSIERKNYLFDRIEKIYRLCGDGILSGNLVRSKKMLVQNFTIKEEYRKQLLDPGAPYEHPSGESLDLNRIFVYPALKSIKPGFYAKSKKNHELYMVNSKNVLQGIGRRIVFGPERSGKTVLCNKLSLELLSKQIIPICINLRFNRNLRVNSIEREMERIFVKNFECHDVEKFRQVDNEYKCIILDDFHLLDTPHREKRKLLKYIANNYKNVMIVADEYLQFEDYLVDDADSFSVFENFDIYEIMQLGYEQRKELVERWFFHIAEHDVNYFKTIDIVSEMLTRLVKKNFVPSYPFYLYIALSAYDVVNPVQIIESTYGSYYQILLTRALVRINAKPAEIDLSINLLAELAYYMYNNSKIQTLTKEFDEFVTGYCSAYQIQINTKVMLSNLVSSKILFLDEDRVYFKYKYYYYYFFAKYLSNNIHNNKIVDIIKRIASEIHLEFNSNSIMFLIYLSKNPVVIESIIEESQKIFKMHPPLQLDQDIDIVNALVETLMPTTYVEVPVEDVRNNIERVKDTLDPNGLPDEISGRAVEVPCLPSDELQTEKKDDLLVMINSTFKSLDVIGQILKSHYGTLPASSKNLLCNEGFFLPLRTLADFLCYYSNHQQDFISSIADLMEKIERRQHTFADKQRKINAFVFQFIELIVMMFISKTAMSMGSEKLQLTFEKMIETHPTISCRLIAMAIEMRTSEMIPFNKIRVLAKDTKNNPLAFSLLRDISIFRLYMYPDSRANKQKLCAMLDINYKAIDALQSSTGSLSLLQ